MLKKVTKNPVFWSEKLEVETGVDTTKEFTLTLNKKDVKKFIDLLDEAQHLSIEDGFRALFKILLSDETEQQEFYDALVTHMDDNFMTATDIHLEITQLVVGKLGNRLQPLMNTVAGLPNV